MKLIIAEKKELAEAIAEAIPGQARKDRQAIIKNGYAIVYLAGHALTLVEPEDVDEKYKEWKPEDLPIYFYPWQQKVIPGKEGLMKLVEEYINKADEAIHAGDIDDEGQLLVDEVLRWFEYQGPVKRLNTSNTTAAALKKALTSMTDNKEHESAGMAAYARAVSDKAFGYSLSRHFTIINKTKLAVGRVQTPTLGLVVMRDEQIENHKKQSFYELSASASIPESTGEASLKLHFSKNSGLLTDGKILNPEALEQTGEEISGKTFKGTVEKKTETESPPLPFNLVELQSHCSKKFNYDPEEIMQITQSLRDKHKAITYNRSDCRYLSSEHFAEAPETTKTTMANLGMDIPVDTSIKSKAFNDGYITAHFAIIPSGGTVRMADLSEKERNVYTEIAHRYLAQFLPAAKKEKTILTVQLDEEKTLTGTDTAILDPGYRILLKPEDDAANDADEGNAQSTLRSLPPGEYDATINSTEISRRETKPAARYTKASLNKDLTCIAKYVTDPEAKRLLQEKDKDKKNENGAIGTSATRDSIIKGLIDRGFLEEKGKHIVSTGLGRQLYNILPPEIKKADMTAKWWAIQEDIISGKAEPTKLTESVLETINAVIRENQDKKIEFTGSKTPAAKVGTCPLCGSAVNDIEHPKLSAYKCENKDCGFILWKKQYGGKLSAANATLLLKKGVTKPIKLKSKEGKPYTARLKFSPDKRKLVLVFENKQKK